MQNNYHRLLIGVFIFFLCWGLVFTYLPPYKNYSNMEGKPLFVIKSQAFTFPNLFSGALFSNVQVMTEDQFPMKESWIAAYARIQMAIGKKNINKKAIGKEGYLAAIHSDQIEDFVFEQIIQLNDRLKEKNIGFLYVVAPTKDYIISDLLPNHLIYKGKDPFKRLHEGLDHGLSWLDLSSVIETEQERLPQYFKTDHHWNHNGYFNAYQAIVENLNYQGILKDQPHERFEYTWKTYPQVFLGSEGRAVTSAVAKDMEDFTIYSPRFASQLSVANLDGETLKIIDEDLITPDVYNNDYAAYLSGTAQYAKIINELDQSKPKAIIVGISYGPPVVGLLADHFSEITYVDLRQFKTKSLNTLIDEEQPDVVIVLYYSGFFTEDMYSFDQIINQETANE